MKKFTVIFFAAAAALMFLHPQQRTRIVEQDRSAAEQRNIERQISYASSLEERGNTDIAYRIISQLASRHPDNLNVLEKYVDISLKAGKIKECETFLKLTVKKYPVQNGQTEHEDEAKAFPFRLLGLLSEFFLRTSREREAYVFFDELNRSGADPKFISEVKAGVFLRAGYYSNAEKIYTDLRKELKDDNIYSRQLYEIYMNGSRTGKLAIELLKLCEAAEKDPAGIKRYQDGFNPRAELFRLFEQEEFKDSILIAAETYYPRSVILSEMYFNSGLYDRSYEVLRSSAGEKQAEQLAAGLGHMLFAQGDFSEAADFYGLAFKNRQFQEDHELVSAYSVSLARSERFKEAEETVLSSRIRDRELLLAMLYHNELNEPEKAAKLYSDHLTPRRDHLHYWKDHIKLKAGLRDFDGAEKLTDRVMSDRMTGILNTAGVNELKYAKALLTLFRKDLTGFEEQAGALVRNEHITDFDNDLIRILNDISVIGDDKDLIRAYIEVVLLGFNPNIRIKDPGISINTTEGTEKKRIASEIQYHYLLSEERYEEVEELYKLIIDSGLLDNSSAKRFVEYAKKRGISENSGKIMLSILKSSVAEPVKIEVREMLRGAGPS